MFDKLSIMMSEGDYSVDFAKWFESEGCLEITIRDHKTTSLPVMDKEDWEAFKRAGDAAFELMEIV